MKKILLGIVGLIVIVFIVLSVLSRFGIGSGANRGSRQGARVDVAKAPQVIKAHFMPLEKVNQISKFRSGAGHDFSDATSPCSSMKHYFHPPADEQYQQTHTLQPPPDGVTDIPIVSPVDGTIKELGNERNDFGTHIWIDVEGQRGMIVRLFHIYPDPEIERDKKVKAGDRLGVIGAHQSTDVAAQMNTGPRKRFLSYFDLMPDSLFADYAKYGIATRDQLIISDEYRQANPLTCDGERFTENRFGNPQDFVLLKSSPTPSTP